MANGYLRKINSIEKYYRIQLDTIHHKELRDMLLSTLDVWTQSWRERIKSNIDIANIPKHPLGEDG